MSRAASTRSVSLAMMYRRKTLSVTWPVCVATTSARSDVVARPCAEGCAESGLGSPLSGTPLSTPCRTRRSARRLCTATALHDHAPEGSRHDHALLLQGVGLRTSRRQQRAHLGRHLDHPAVAVLPRAGIQTDLIGIEVDLPPVDRATYGPGLRGPDPTTWEQVNMSLQSKR